MKVLGTGLSGLVGSRIVELLNATYEFEDVSKETGADITDFEDIQKRIRMHTAEWVFHLAAYTDVQGAEKEKGNGKNSLPWIVNVEATRHIVEACMQSRKRILYVSTDYVFDGTKDTYSEEDKPSPKGWYAVTKYEGEKCVQEASDSGLIIRIANPYRAYSRGKKDFVHKIIERLTSSGEVKAPDDSLFVPTFIDDVAVALDTLVRSGASGVWHVVGADALSPYDAARMIAHTFGYDVNGVNGVPFKQFVEGRAPYPQKAAMTSSKTQAAGITMRTFSQGLSEMKRQETIRLESGVNAV